MACQDSKMEDIVYCWLEEDISNDRICGEFLEDKDIRAV